MFRSHEQLDITILVPLNKVGIRYDSNGFEYYCGFNREGYRWFVDEYLPEQEQRTGIEIDRKSIEVSQYKVWSGTEHINENGYFPVTIQTMAHYPD